MSKTRVDESGIERREAEINAYEGHIKRLEVLQGARNSEAMKIILEGAGKADEMARNKLVELAGYGDEKNTAEIFQLGGELKAYRALLNDFGNTKDAIEKARGEIEKRKNIIKNAKAAHGMLAE